MIEEHNLNAKEHGFTLAMNQFGDLTDSEFSDIYNGFQANRSRTVLGSSFVPTPGFSPMNDSVDWRKEGVVTPVKNQGDCGSCWAFSAVGSLEAQHRLSGKTLVSLSEQNLMDCTQAKKYGNMACLGGTMDVAFQYIIDNGGVDTEASYPYLAQTETQCRFNVSNVGATMSKFVDVPDNELALTEACKEKGPISVAIDGAWITFRFYKSGVYYEPRCYTTKLNHGVLVVGYGVEADTGQDYYWVKNSWGAAWGLDGYVKMSRNRNNNCGIASVASYPVV
jgi:cathepsin L